MHEAQHIHLKAAQMKYNITYVSIQTKYILRNVCWLKPMANKDKGQRHTSV